MQTSVSGFLAVLSVFLAVGVLVALCLFSSRVRRPWLRRSLFITASGVSVVSAGFLYLGASYGWALHLESRWRSAEPNTKADLEACLSLYLHHEIQPIESGWGSTHDLKNGEKMIQYLLLWSAPLDVVYAAYDRVVAIYSSRTNSSSQRRCAPWLTRGV